MGMFGTGSRIKVARIGGIPIYVSYSWFVIAGLFGVGLYSSYSDQPTSVDPGRAMQLTLIVLVLFFGGVLLHEAAHAIAARSFGLPVRAITLVFWGGATETRSWRKGPLADFVVSASGPATTGLMWLLFAVLRDQTDPFSEMHDVWTYLAFVNALMFGLNLLPGFPLDGGRMLMAIAWGVSRKRALAMRVAGVGSLLVGGGLIVWAVLEFGKGNGGAIFAGYIGFVMISVGRQIPPRAALRERLERGTARDAMRPVTDPIPADATVYEATEQWLRARPKHSFPVADNGRLVGTLSFEEAANASAARRVRDVMVTLYDPPLIGEDEPLDDVVEWVGDRDGLVVDVAKRPVGLIAVEDVDAWLKAHWSTGTYVELPTVVLPPRPDQ
jgi:Zn-dependent protease